MNKLRIILTSNRGALISEFANKLSHVLASDQTPGEFDDLLTDIIREMANVADIDLTAPEIIKFAFPVLMDNLKNDYANGLFDSIQLVLENLPDDLKEELAQYEEQHLAYENRNNESDAELQKLAAQISEIVANPLIPKSLYNAITCEIAEISEEMHTPKNVLYNLKKLKENEV